MPLRNLVRTASAVALAVPVLAGLTAISASAEEVAPATTTTTQTDAPVVQTVDAEPAPVLFTAAYTRW